MSAYLVSDDDFIDAVKTNTSIRAVLLKLGMNATGGAYKTFKALNQTEGLAISNV